MALVTRFLKWLPVASLMLAALSIAMTTMTAMSMKDLPRMYEMTMLDTARLNAKARSQAGEIRALRAEVKTLRSRQNWYIQARSGIRELERLEAAMEVHSEQVKEEESVP
jgi:hypothetical protein